MPAAKTRVSLIIVSTHVAKICAFETYSFIDKNLITFHIMV